MQVSDKSQALLHSRLTVRLLAKKNEQMTTCLKEVNAMRRRESTPLAVANAATACKSVSEDEEIFHTA